MRDGATDAHDRAIEKVQFRGRNFWICVPKWAKHTRSHARCWFASVPSPHAEIPGMGWEMRLSFFLQIKLLFCPTTHQNFLHQKKIRSSTSVRIYCECTIYCIQKWMVAAEFLRVELLLFFFFALLTRDWFDASVVSCSYHLLPQDRCKHTHRSQYTFSFGIHVSHAIVGLLYGGQ